ncbi:BREX-2 system adenine-specific DNA-methyltransferase PglX [Nocardia iowensis]|uniref:site-specific DNA-methyltransferase (adenine-specific) n=1 Tax=Nocardia iowensis TaxID=204891 RepID=A0ABX8RXM3_NOCIO|nr:BREX-2 system adenine-specific DNA-methyltransferase PglX [Nocardia iowensis]QXN93150.1 BREX-2 system adenine-specific DNA-methyltransferase PglX [Nocardia iowensis]
MTGIVGLVPALRKLVLTLENDLRARIDGPEVAARQGGAYTAWRGEYDEASAARRTAASWEAWRDERVSQSAVAWVLLTVFARYVEDNALVTPRWIAGATPDERRNALDARQAYFAEQTTPEFIPSDREWLEQIVTHFARYDATRALVDEYSPLHRVAPSGDAARAILEFWWYTDESGETQWSFTGIDSRFLGDVYQDLSEYAKKTYALLQTPEFVEEFILDQTLTPALAERQLEGFTVIDPTCGSGHFLLGAFRRVLREWERQAPALPVRVLVGRAIASVYGVDINAAAVAIARFRLLLAALEKSGEQRIEQAVDFELNLATGDSLLWGARQQALGGMTTFGLTQFTYSIENAKMLAHILQREHDVVVGNPPYITVKDSALNSTYRLLYSSCHRQYALTVPFIELFFDLGYTDQSTRKAGWVGQITSNSFMKREFGSKLIENFLPTRDLRQVIDTSGAYIPGHGTPTVIATGRNRPPTSDHLRAILGIRGESGRPDDPANAEVWSSIRDNIDNPGFENTWISVVELPRDTMDTHPWSLTGGGAVDTQAAIENGASNALSSLANAVGLVAIPGEDSAFLLPNMLTARRIRTSAISIIEGDQVRDYTTNLRSVSIWPYNNAIEPSIEKETLRSLWPNRRILQRRKRFGVPIEDIHTMHWWEIRELYKDKLKRPLTITFPLVSTHNHFAIDRGGSIFHHSAPVIKLPERATLEDHISLAATLNSSAACFWLKQNSHDKGNGGYGGGIADQEWERFYELTGATLKNFPLPPSLPLDRGRILDQLAQELKCYVPHYIVTCGGPTADSLNTASQKYTRLIRQMIAHQEELDWECYRLYGLTDEDLTYPGDVPEISLGQRVFEILLARRMKGGEQTSWFERHRSTPITEIPQHLPDDYRQLLQRRLDAIADNPHLRLLEKPEYKRRWATEPWDKRVTEALRDWLLDKVEDHGIWFDRDDRPTPKSVATLADELDRDADFARVLRMWAQSPEASTSAALKRLLTEEGVPFLAAYRYKPSGLEKRKAWEHTWAEQRREDAGESLDKPIPVPPKYKPTDFTKPSYWSRRGKLDVPKERFISYPNANSPNDKSELLGWAGWNHAEQALALAGIIGNRIQDGAAEATLTPLVAGLMELSPWVRQWHSEIDLEYGISMADLIEEEIRTHCVELGIAPEDAAAWRPEPAGRGRRTTARSEEAETLL